MRRVRKIGLILLLTFLEMGSNLDHACFSSLMRAMPKVSRDDLFDGCFTCFHLYDGSAVTCAKFEDTGRYTKFHNTYLMYMFNI